MNGESILINILITFIYKFRLVGKHGITMFFPLLLLSFQVAKMMLVVVVVFVICWSPYFIVTVVTQLQTVNFMNEGHFFFTMLCINLLGFANSCFNSLVYFAMSARFRRVSTHFLVLIPPYRNVIITTSIRLFCSKFTSF